MMKLEDLKNIKEYIAEDNEEMAVESIQEIYNRIENIRFVDAINGYMRIGYQDNRKNTKQDGVSY